MRQFVLRIERFASAFYGVSNVQRAAMKSYIAILAMLFLFAVPRISESQESEENPKALFPDV